MGTRIIGKFHSRRQRDRCFAPLADAHGGDDCIRDQTFFRAASPNPAVQAATAAAGNDKPHLLNSIEPSAHQTQHDT
jgi:hypothetical protein